MITNTLGWLVIFFHKPLRLFEIEFQDILQEFPSSRLTGLFVVYNFVLTCLNLSQIHPIPRNSCVSKGLGSPVRLSWHWKGKNVMSCLLSQLRSMKKRAPGCCLGYLLRMKSYSGIWGLFHGSHDIRIPEPLTTSISLNISGDVFTDSTMVNHHHLVGTLWIFCQLP